MRHALQRAKTTQVQVPIVILIFIFELGGWGRQQAPAEAGHIPPIRRVYSILLNVYVNEAPAEGCVRNQSITGTMFEHTVHIRHDLPREEDERSQAKREASRRSSNVGGISCQWKRASS